MTEKDFPWFARRSTIVALLTIGAIAGVTSFAIATQRTGDPKPTVTWERVEGDFKQIDISWPIPLNPGAVASPERTDMAGNILANLLSDPSWRGQVELWYRHYLSIGHEQDEASAMAKAHAAQIALAFTDALIEAAGE